MALTDGFANNAVGTTSPATDFFDITPQDATDLAVIPRAIYVGVGGDLVITSMKGATKTFKNVPTGFILPVRVNQVQATNTTASSLIGLV